MGLLDIALGKANPIASYVDANKFAIHGAFSGLGSGQNISQGLSNAAQGANTGAQQDSAYALTLADQKSRLDQIAYEREMQQNALKLQVAQRNAAADWVAKDPAMAPYEGAVRAGAITGGDVFNTVNKNMIIPAGATPADYQGKPVPGGVTSSGFPATDLKSQAWNTVILANRPGADPALKASPQFQAAFAIVTEPTMTPQGMMQPNIPKGWGPTDPSTAAAANSSGAVPPPAADPSSLTTPAIAAPVASGAPAQPAFVAPPSATGNGLPMVAPPALVSSVPGVLPGTQPFNESQSRVTDLASMAIPDLKTAITNYPALANPKDQVLQKISQIDPTGLAHGAQSDQYQQAYSSTRAAISNILYTVSGAAIGDKELERKVEDLTPQIGDHAPVVADKLNRLANYVSSIANSTKDPQTIARAQQALAGIKAAQDQLAGKAEPATPGQKVPAGTPIWDKDGKQYIMGPDGQPVPTT